MIDKPVKAERMGDQKALMLSGESLLFANCLSLTAKPEGTQREQTGEEARVEAKPVPVPGWEEWDMQRIDPVQQVTAPTGNGGESSSSRRRSWKWW